MECNRDEAIRAKEIAQKKMQNNDFDGALKIAMKAQQLFPQLENINHLLAVCNVHISAQSRILGSERDWYSILQLEKKADEATIKKQYKKLALLLHPDKNQFPGAEAAFKLIGEAHVFLSDHGKKALYDNRIGALSKSAQGKNPPYQMNKNPPTRKQDGVCNSMPNGYASHFNGLNHKQTSQSNTNSVQQSFWTCCPFCQTQYEYRRTHVNLKLICNNCRRQFIAIDIGLPRTNQAQASSQGVPPRSTYQTQAAPNNVQARSNNQMQTPSCGVPSSFRNQAKVASQSVPAGYKGSQPSASQGTHKSVEQKATGLPPRKAEGASSLGGGNATAAGKVDPSRTEEEASSRVKKRKGQGKNDAESSESFGASSSSDSEEVIIEDILNDAATHNSGLNGVNGLLERRRSSRQRHRVSYIESDGDDGDFESPPVRPQVGKSSCGSKELQEDSLKKGSLASNEESQPKDSGKNKKTENISDEVDVDAQMFESIDDSESDSGSGDDGCREFYNCPDPEFNDFDKDREESCFLIGQFWACYDSMDGMPRYYAKIKGINSNPFKLRISWLEANPEDEFSIGWGNKGLPIGCGRYRIRGESTLERLAFSHQIVYSRKKGSLVVYPRKGEAWALFRDWDIGWVKDSEIPATYDYDIVEVLSEYAEDAGVEVAYLVKVKGFISLFRHSERSTYILPNEVLRFSHRIPSFKMRGDEREGVPAGCFELDTASLTSEHVEDAKSGGDSKISEITPKKSDKYFKENGVGGETSKPRSSPRELDTADKKDSGTSAAASSSSKGSSACMNSKKSRGYDDYIPSKAEVRSEEMDQPTQMSSPRKSRRLQPESSPSRSSSQEPFHDFTGERSAGKFAVGQFWALYMSDDKLPRMYGVIKKIASSPLNLYVALLESCQPPENGMHPVCGTFKVRKGVEPPLEPSSFSHLLHVNPSQRGTYEIYPQVGQVWALYKNHSGQLSSSETKSSDYELVEVAGGSVGCLEVLSLVQYKGYKSVFRHPRKSRSGDGAMEIQVKDLVRFSHQIPAFKLTTERGGLLSGSWELDPAALPLNLSCVK